MPQKRHLLLAERRHLRSSHRQCALSCRNPQGTLKGVPWWSKWRLVVLGEGRKEGVRPSHMLITGHEPGLTASSARDTSLTAQYGSKHRQSSNSCASVALPHFPSARRSAHASPTCGHERRAFAAVQRRVSDTRESDMCADVCVSRASDTSCTSNTGSVRPGRGGGFSAVAAEEADRHEGKCRRIQRADAVCRRCGTRTAAV